MIGQDALKEYLNKSNLDTFPRTLMLLGEDGCGKHLFCSMIAEKFNMSLINITDNLKMETLDSIMTSANVNLYVIDGYDITIKEQNVILKFLEEPLKNVYIAILGYNKNQFLDTIANRCQVMTFKPYTNEELKGFIDFECDIDKLLRIARTPGRIKILKDYNMSEYYSLADKIISKLSISNYANALTLYEKIPGVKDDKKIFQIFLNVLTYVARDKILAEDSNVNYLWYESIVDLCKKAQVANVDYKYLFDNFLSNMWRKVKVNDN